MPAKNILKTYIKDGYYHVYNRGVEKRKIFIDNNDYLVFLRYLKEYLLPPDHKYIKKLRILTKANLRRNPINCQQCIQLIAYCLMPNHFHLFLKQKTEDGLKHFMSALLTNYVMYFNKKYHRVGPLFQGRYKGVLITSEPHYLHITRYIHQNPLSIARVGPLQKYPYSSYKYYLGNVHSPDWLDFKHVLALFRSAKNLHSDDILSYQSFVEKYPREKNEEIKTLLLDLQGTDPCSD